MIDNASADDDRRVWVGAYNIYMVYGLTRRDWLTERRFRTGGQQSKSNFLVSSPQKVGKRRRRRGLYYIKTRDRQSVRTQTVLSLFVVFIPIIIF